MSEYSLQRLSQSDAVRQHVLPVPHTRASAPAAADERWWRARESHLCLSCRPLDFWHRLWRWKEKRATAAR